MSGVRLCCLFLLWIVCVIIPSLAVAAEEWEAIAAEPVVIDFNGRSRQLEPGCALDLVQGGISSYRFYYKPGKLDRLLILFNGGGACWNGQTCLDSIFNPEIVPTYVPMIDVEHNQVANWDGVLNFETPDNPFKEWSILFLPYCTGDVHIGSNDQVYGSYPIRHRGFDNFLYAREWLRQRYGTKIDKVKKVFVAGSSAGAYGAAFNFPYIKQVFPSAKGYLLADSGNGVFVDDFIEQAMHFGEASWQVDANLPTWVPGIESLPSQTAATYIVSLYSSLADYYSKDKFASYTTAWDAVQVMFYNIMLNPVSPELWVPKDEEDEDAINSLMTAYSQWPVAMQTFAYQLAANENYRFYIAPGCEHTLLRDEKLFGDAEIDGIPFLNWLQGMLGEPPYEKDWQNLLCSDCPFPSFEEIEGCLAR